MKTDTQMEETNTDDTNLSNQEKLARQANARFGSLPAERPTDLMGGAKSTSFARRGPPPPIKINSGSCFRDNPFLKKK